MIATLNRGTRELLRRATTDALQAARWMQCYEASGNPEHRLNAIRAVMDARDVLQRAEVCVKEGLAQRTEVTT